MLSDFNNGINIAKYFLSVEFLDNRWIKLPPNITTCNLVVYTF